MISILLKLYITKGSSKNGQNILPYRKLSIGGNCNASNPPTCTAISLNDLQWHLHREQSYYVSIKSVNIAGMHVIGSARMLKRDGLVSKGLVQDIDDSRNLVCYMHAFVCLLHQIYIKCIIQLNCI
jgi:hypothetical protein